MSVLLLVEDPFLIVVRDSIIYGISMDPDDKSNDAMVPVAGLQNGYDVDFDDNEHTIYWVEHPVSDCTEQHSSSWVFFVFYQHAAVNGELNPWPLSTRARSTG